ncbi:putative Dynein regulatory complex subunit 3 [Hypsibius exemplaris]|uniref:Dynein regulatory complex subunit 3 n=1 Tax=Hypsibius exemplaris TaxID=2072580 RepID=A0A1W0WTA8_HYPEX|nr:putative Dynein regulatory complex subunit 3 [Hypsibius exemplaris]
MHDHPSTAHSFSDFNRGMQTRRYIKPTICNRHFLTTMSMDLRPEKEWGYHLAKTTGIDIGTIVELNLEFSNVQSTYGIGYLRSCQKLKLNNNIISRIIGMDDLMALKVLDLSFNSIDRIEGLDKCLELEELMLFHNTISKIEGVSSLKKLVLLNLGCNQIKTIQEVHALRHLPALRSLNFERNPVCKVPHYRSQIIVWISQVRCLDWKRILAPARVAAAELFREKYRSLLSKERSEEKRRKAQKAADEEADLYLTQQDGLLSHEFGGSLFKFLNPSEEELLLLLDHIPGGPAALQSYQQQLTDSGNQMAKKFSDLFNTFKCLASEFDGRIKHMLLNYGACGKLLVEGFLLRKYNHLEAIKEEVDVQGKENLRKYCRLIDDVSHDLVKLLMQLEQKVESLVKIDEERLMSKLTQETTWTTKETEILRQFEEHFFKWADGVRRDDNWTGILSPEVVTQIRQALPDDKQQEAQFWLNSLTTSSMRNLMQARLYEKVDKLIDLEKSFHNRLMSENDWLANYLEGRQERLYHRRMQEILDFVEQHKAEAFLTRKRAMARHGTQETDEDLEIGPEVCHAMQHKAKIPATPVSSTSHAERLKKVEFESDEPLADYVVLKDIKDVVDQIAHMPLTERKRLFETRVVDVDDIADYVYVKDEPDEQVFAQNLKKMETDNANQKSASDTSKKE